MKQITLDGLVHYVWEYEPEWGAGVTGRFKVEVDEVASLTKRQQRRAYGETLRVEMEASYVLSGAEAAEARNALRVLQDTPVRMPFLVGLDDLGANYQARWYLAFDYVPSDPAAVTNLYWTNGDADINGRTHIVPTLLGFLSDAPEFELIHDELFSTRIRWRESSDFAEALQVAAQEWTDGPAIGARTIKEFPFAPDFQGTESAGHLEVEVDRQNLGFSRTWSSAAYPQIGSRQPKFTYTMRSRLEVATMLRFFQDVRGTVEAFWLPCWVGECRLAVDVAAGDAVVTVTDATALGDHRYLQFFGPKGQVTRKVTGIAGNVLTLESAPGIAFKVDDTLLCTLALARFSSAELVVRWANPDLAQAEIQFEEVTQEYLTPIGEVYGGTIGALPTTCFLYQLNTAGLSFYWTSYEKDLTYGGNAYAAEAIEHDEVSDGMAWDQSNCSVKLRSWAGNPILQLVTRTATDRMELIIAKGTPPAGAGDVTNYEVLFRGWVTTATLQGAWVTADVQGFGSLFSRQIPRTTLRQTDNYALFDAGNRLLRADWTFTARLTAVAGNVLTLDTLTWPGGALPAIPDNYFALGQLERPIAGGGVERVPIVSSTAIAGGVVTVTMAHGFMKAAPVPPEVGWSLVPGYNGYFATTIAKFANAVNFGGFPFIPATNPSLVPMPTNQTPSSKK